jgi:two-component SAPR family response regulator
MSSSDSVSLDGLRVLIVEDNFIVADSLKELVTAYGGAVAAMVPDLEKALAAAEERPVDVAILDIDLRGTNVAPVARRLHDQRVGFIFLSGYGDENLLPEDLRGRPRLDKPVDPDRLIRALLEVTGRLA